MVTVTQLKHRYGKIAVTVKWKPLLRNEMCPTLYSVKVKGFVHHHSPHSLTLLLTYSLLPTLSTISKHSLRKSNAVIFLKRTVSLRWTSLRSCIWAHFPWCSLGRKCRHDGEIMSIVYYSLPGKLKPLKSIHCKPQSCCLTYNIPF